jgi:hypothetical protein
MDQVTIVAIVVGVLVLALVGWYLWQRQRSEALRARYGPEYDRAVREAGDDRRRAESELLERQERVEHLDIRPLRAEQREDYQQRWRAVQAKFVDDPRGAVSDADGLVEDVMKARGYPVSDFDQRAADLSVHHPAVVSNYRAARDIAQRHRRGEASTEDLRQAMVHYRALFQDLLEDREHEEERARDEAKARERDRSEERLDRAERRGEGAREREVERQVARDERHEDRLEVPVRRVADGERERADRSNERIIRNEGEVRP